MKIAVLGTGKVGETVGAKLVALGHEVRMGSRTASNDKALAWVAKAGDGASTGTFRDAAKFADVVFNCTSGTATLAALELAGADSLRGKIVVDLANPLDFSKGMPPRLAVFNDDSLGEQVQRAFPDAKVVKTLNTVSCDVMIDPSRVPGDHTMFVCGDDAEAKATVTEWLRSWFGWSDVLDLGNISMARGTESYLPLWLRLWGALGTANFNVKVVRG
jgi:predicted dinucleotide-binding enzyme